MSLPPILRSRVEEAVARAREQGRRVIASATVPFDPHVDVSACVFAGRRVEERWFVWGQPDRDGFALGALGAAHTVTERDAAGACAEALRDGVFEPEAGTAGAGPVWVGGFAFFADGGTEPHWASFESTLLVLPELSLVRSGSAAWATVNVSCGATDDAAALAERAYARLAALRTGALPLVDPDPAGGYELESARPPTEFERAVAEAAALVRAGEVDKVVLAREVRVTAARPFDPAAVFGALRSAYPSCYCYCAGTREAAFVGASPELLVRRAGGVVSTVALAGSTRRSADPAVDDHLGERLLHSAKEREEHSIVVRTISRALSQRAMWVTAAEEPMLVKVANIQHLATPVRAQLADPQSAVALALGLHPTSAVGGEPWSRAEPLVRRLERMDRGWYAAPLGWMDAAEDGEFCVALRCALLAGRTAHCYAGGGIVGDSDPEAELAETEVKLQAVLPALTGS